MKKVNYYPGLYEKNLYHIYNRGNGKEKIFFNHSNYIYFLGQLYNYLSDFLDFFAYCLIPNHFHILARVKAGDPDMISEQFRRFFISYSMSINKQEKRKGSLFQRGFKRKLIENENYFYSAVYYIHSNPVHHNIIKDFKEYEYSSYKSFKSVNNTALCRDEVFSWFGGKENFIKYHEEFNTNFYSDSYMIEDD